MLENSEFCKRYKTKKLYVGNVAIGGDAKISVQSMTFSKTHNVKATLEQINRLYFAGCDIVRCAVLSVEDATALQEIKEKSPLPIIADIHFNYKHALRVAPFVDAIRINPGNIGGKERIKAVVDACKQRNLPIRIGVNSGSLEEEFEKKYGRTVDGMLASAEYNFKLLEDFDFRDIAISLKSSDVFNTMQIQNNLKTLALQFSTEKFKEMFISLNKTEYSLKTKTNINKTYLLLSGLLEFQRILSRK